MTSWQTRLICVYLRLSRKPAFSTVERGLDRMANGQPDSRPPGRIADRCSVTEVGGFDVCTVRPSGGAPANGALVYLHGGAFINGIVGQHWSLVAELADATRREVHVPLYGLAPDHDADDARALLDALHERLGSHAPLHLAGDSAGGNLAMLMAQMHAAEGTIAGLTLIAPWLDLSMSNPGIEALEPHDPWLSRAGLRPVAAAWAREHGLQDPAVSPLFGDLAALPSTAVFVGSRDICLPDCRLLAERAPVALHLVEGSPHVYPLLPTPEGRRARGQIVAHIEQSFTMSPGAG